MVPTSRPAVADYSYGSPTTAPASPREELEQATRQWPEKPAERMRSMTDRLNRVMDRLNAAGGTQCLAMLGQTSELAKTNGDGTITVDAGMLWRLDEDALAAVIAREVARDTLRHQEQMNRLADQKGSPGVAQRAQVLDQSVDEYAGRLLARTPYQPGGYRDALRHVGTVGGDTPQADNGYYTQARRIDTFEQSYRIAQGVEQQLLARASSQPAPKEAASRPAGQ